MEPKAASSHPSSNPSVSSRDAESASSLADPAVKWTIFEATPDLLLQLLVYRIERNHIEKMCWRRCDRLLLCQFCLRQDCRESQIRKPTSRKRLDQSARVKSQRNSLSGAGTSSSRCTASSVDDVVGHSPRMKKRTPLSGMRLCRPSQRNATKDCILRSCRRWSFTRPSLSFQPPFGRHS